MTNNHTNECIRVMVNGLPGSMARIVSEKVMGSKDMYLVHDSLTGPEVDISHLFLHGHRIDLINPSEKDGRIEDVKGMHPKFISVDYSHPTAVNSNAEFYCAESLPFVMGTTGGDRKKLEEMVKDSEICAVIAPNMAKEIVVLQAMMKYAADNFPNSFEGYSLNITESHQKGKADTSGTAKVMVEHFNSLGIPFSKDQINKVRDEQLQRRMGVPEEYLSGHGWHTYTIQSKNGSVFLSITHNVNGREAYVDGTLKAVRYLSSKVKAGEKGKIYSMEDVAKR